MDVVGDVEVTLAICLLISEYNMNVPYIPLIGKSEFTSKSGLKLHRASGKFDAYQRIIGPVSN